MCHVYDSAMHSQEDTNTVSPPDHHIRYARAWDLYRDNSLPDDLKIILEQEMDSAQNHFEWNEFQEFKKNLQGFIEHWEGLKKTMLSKMDKC